ncbi:type II toxin-antitoxin system RelE/ParE family toxin [Brevundimonas sp. SL130]|uniref:type II toxin-antitoxin system RelE/ParE family toxin n=1 Tax=Brevundimonas sp. SL130 TaxID=2995143 RepID=UPI00226C8FF4|nr:type II toxin-antitoxin system RelE/ParE family toxin [Brevundimonas sp. SL130]WAC60833.1 type II toxin-antitoxin system RelE/ParE family toxin [Brevundimonas sp. SL130]
MKIRLSLDAIQDRRRVIGFLRGVNPNAARRAGHTITRSIGRLAETPMIGIDLDGLRHLYIPFGASGYVVQYRVDADVVVVARIFHAREER